MSIGKFHENALERLLENNLDAAQELGISQLGGRPVRMDVFDDYSSEGFECRKSHAANLLSQLRTFDPASQTSDERISTEILSFFLQYGFPGFFPGTLWADIPDLRYPVNCINGTHMFLLNLLVGCPPFISRDDAEAYVNRLSQIPKAFGQLEAQVIAQAAEGIAPPESEINRVIKEMRTFVSCPAAQNILCVSAVSKLECTGLEQADKDDILNRITRAIEKAVYPSFFALIKALDAALDVADERIGICKFSGGRDFYRLALQTNTTVSKGPEEIHELGLAEVERVQREIKQLLKELGFHNSSVKECFNQIAQDDRFRYENSDQGRDAIMEDLNRYFDDIHQRAPEIFSELPKSELVIQAIPKVFEQSANSNFEPSALDGSRPAIFNACLGDMLKVPKFELPIITYHEAIPGHGLQCGLAQELTGLPPFRRSLMFNAYGEGWAKYAEKLPLDSGFNIDPWVALGRWRMELYSSATLVMDTGIHYYGWTQEKAVDYWVKNTFVTQDYAEKIVHRIMLDPGQTPCYKIGMLKMFELKARMQDKLGRQYSPKHFHRTVLNQGSLPLSVLEQVVDDEIERLTEPQ